MTTSFFFCATCGPVELDIHGRCGLCGSNNVTQTMNVIVAGGLTPARELTGIEKHERSTAR